jgi:hypothetical protein
MVPGVGEAVVIPWRMRPRAALWLSLLVVAPLSLRAQQWNDPRAIDLVTRATERRVQQLSDSGLVDYRATAHGYVTFLAQLGEGFRTPPKVVKADELALEVYWKAPNLSKQRIVGRRDTTLLPTDIAYHRDHLGIVQNNFPAIIRIGDGDEVRDVPHPLSEDGLRQYQFALTDSLRITAPGRVIEVYEVQVRPVDDQQPRIAGAVYLERSTAQVVRMAFGFTRAAYLDKQLEDLFVVLENGLVGSRFWLPRRQEIEIRRSVRWMDYPARGIIRGRWEIGDYVLNAETPRGVFVGPEITEVPRAMQRSFPWATGRIVDSLPLESKLPTPTEILRVQEAARSLVREQALARRRGGLFALGASDFVRFDRNSGMSLGGGLSANVGAGYFVSVRGRYGLDDERGRGRVEAGWRHASGSALTLFAHRDTRDVGDVAERSTLVNSIAAQEFGSDATDQYGVRGVGTSMAVPIGPTRLQFDAAFEDHRRLDTYASPFNGGFRAAFEPGELRVRSITVRADRPPSPGWFGFEWRASVEGRASFDGTQQDTCVDLVCDFTSQVRRAGGSLELSKLIGPVELATRTFAAGAWADTYLLSQDLVFIGGPVSAPGFQVHELVGDRAVSQNLELRLPVPFPAMNLGRFGRAASKASLAPHWTLVGVHRASSATSIIGYSSLGPIDAWRPRPSGWYHSAGIGFIAFFDLVRIDVSREMPNGRWRFSIDISRPFWPIL